MKLDPARTLHRHAHADPGEQFVVFKGSAAPTVMQGETQVAASQLAGLLMADAKAAGKDGIDAVSAAEAALDVLFDNLFARLDAAASPLVAELQALRAVKSSFAKLGEQAMKAKK